MTLVTWISPWTDFKPPVQTLSPPPWAWGVCFANPQSNIDRWDVIVRGSSNPYTMLAPDYQPSMWVDCVRAGWRILMSIEECEGQTQLLWLTAIFPERHKSILQKTLELRRCANQTYASYKLITFPLAPFKLVPLTSWRKVPAFKSTLRLQLSLIPQHPSKADSWL